MVPANAKPLNWVADPNIGYRVERRPDGGMVITFTDVSSTTLAHWREFSLQHLLDSDRLTRNLYDLRQITELPVEAVNVALEVNTDPSVRNIRLAVVVATQSVYETLQQINALSLPGGVEMTIFFDMDEAQSWLERPLTQLY